MLHRLRQPAAVLLLMIAAPMATLAAPPPAPLKVMSFNIRTPADTEPGRRWEDRRQAMVTVIKDAHPAVMGTQELKKEQADYLAEALTDYRWFGQGRQGGDIDEHMGVFYDANALALQESGDFWLSDTPDVAGSISWGHPMPRMVTWGLFRRVQDGRLFYVLNTHLPYRDEDEPARVRGAKAIVAHLKTLRPGVPVVLTGDFNSEPGGPTYETFKGILADTRTQVKAPKGPRLTFHNFTGTPTTQIDWVLVRGFKARDFATLDTRVDGILPSDHFPVVVELDWADTAGP